MKWLYRKLFVVAVFSVCLAIFVEFLRGNTNEAYVYYMFICIGAIVALSVKKIFRRIKHTPIRLLSKFARFFF